jgi:hypothetical protein
MIKEAGASSADIPQIYAERQHTNAALVACGVAGSLTLTKVRPVNQPRQRR